MKVDIGTILGCPAEAAWREVRTPGLLVRVMRPLLRVAPVDPPLLPERWEDGRTYRLRAYAFGFIPLGWHDIHFERIDEGGLRMETRERGTLLRRWDHRISLDPRDARACRYRDEVEIEAGPLTAGVWLWANWFYRHRQRRWRRIAAEL